LPDKRLKEIHRSSKVVAIMKGSDKPLCVLLDSSTTQCIVLKRYR